MSDFINGMITYCETKKLFAPGDFSMKTYDAYEFVSGPVEFNKFTSKAKGPILVLYHGVPSAPKANDIHFSNSDINILDGNKVFLLRGDFKLRGKPYDLVINYSGTPSMVTFISNYLYIVGLEWDYFPTADKDNLTFPSELSYQFEDIKDIPPTVYQVDEEQVGTFMRDSRIHQISKFLSILYSSFRQLIPWMTRSFPITQYSPPQRRSYGTTLMLSKEVMCAQCITCFALRYSNAYTASTQVYRRGAATAAANWKDTFPSLDEFKQFWNQTAWDIRIKSDVYYETLGRVAILDKEFKYDPNLRFADLADIDSLSTHFHLNEWSRALLRQIRLVYKYFRLTSIQFADNVYNNAKDLFTNDGGKWKEEVERFYPISGTTYSKMYSGLRRETEYASRISNFPRLVYTGLYWHMLSLPDDKSKKAFEKYNLARIKKKIQPISDIAICEAHAKSFPKPDVQAIAKIIAGVSMNKASFMMERYSTEKQAEIIQVLMDAHKDSAYAHSLLTPLKQTTPLFVSNESLY